MLDFNIASLLRETEINYTISRQSSTVVRGVVKRDVAITFDLKMTVTSAKKEDVISENFSEKDISLLKVRVLNEEGKALDYDDSFEYGGDTYKITRIRPYQEGITDFKIYYAQMVGR